MLNKTLKYVLSSYVNLDMDVGTERHEMVFGFGVLTTREFGYEWHR